MHDWHDARSIEAVRGQSRHENARYIIRWCFTDKEHALAFQLLFDGELSNLKKTADE
jgi:hypothetical protein